MRVASVGTAVSKYGQDAAVGQNLTKVPFFFSPAPLTAPVQARPSTYGVPSVPLGAPRHSAATTYSVVTVRTNIITSLNWHSSSFFFPPPHHRQNYHGSLPKQNTTVASLGDPLFSPATSCFSFGLSSLCSTLSLWPTALRGMSSPPTHAFFAISGFRLAGPLHVVICRQSFLRSHRLCGNIFGDSVLRQYQRRDS